MKTYVPILIYGNPLMALYIIPQHVFPSRLFAISLKSIKQEKSIPLVVNELKKINNMEF